MTETGPLIHRDRSVHPLPHAPGYKTSVTRSPNLPLLSLPSTITEETGPVFGHNQLGPLDNDLIRNFTGGKELAIGERIIVHGRVLDENNRPQAGVLVEAWQANASGRYRHAKVVGVERLRGIDRAQKGDQPRITSADFARQDDTLTDGVLGEEPGFDFAQFDAEAANFDLEVDTAAVFEVAIGEATDFVACFVEALPRAEWVGDEAFGRELVSVEVAW